MNQTKKPIQVALIGCGRISGHHSRSIAKMQGIQLAAVCDLVQEKADTYAKEFEVPAFTNYHEMFQKIHSIELVAVVTPSGMHFEHVTEIMSLYRKHIIVEKPTFMKPSQVTKAYAIAKELGLTLFPVFQNRHNKAVKRVLLGLKNGELGKVRILSVRVRWCRPQRYYDLADWRGTFSQDGGALTNQGIHHIDLLRQFGGEPTRVNALMKTLGANIEVEDTVVGTVEFESGAVGNLEITTSARPIDYEASLSIVCEKGLAQIGGIAVNELQIYSPEPSACSEHSENFQGNVYGYGHEFIYREIASHFEKKQPYSVSEEDCLKTIQLLDAFYRADEKGGWVNVKENSESLRLGRVDEKLAFLYRSCQIGAL